MWTEDSAAISGDSEGCFLMATEGNDCVIRCVRLWGAEIQRKWGETASESDDGGSSGDDSDHAVINRPENGALVCEKKISIVKELLPDFRMSEDDGVSFDIGAGDDNRMVEVIEYEVMEGCGGKEDSDGPEGTVDIGGNI